MPTPPPPFALVFPLFRYPGNHPILLFPLRLSRFPRTALAREKRELAVFVVDNHEYLYVGYLYKKGKKVKNWKRRAFVLTSEALIYTEDLSAKSLRKVCTPTGRRSRLLTFAPPPDPSFITVCRSFPFLASTAVAQGDHPD